MSPRRMFALAAALAVAAACSEHLPRAFATSGGDAGAFVDASADADALTVDATADGDTSVDAAATDGADGEADAAPDADIPDADSDGGACNVRLAAPALVASPHVPEGTVVVYTSNPPSSGPHYPDWANFEEFNHPVDDPYLVHSLEHGAVLLLYNCDLDAGDCADAVAKLRAIRDAVPTDPICDPGIRVRMIIAPRPLNDTMIAAAAWGFTYRADCVDTATLTAFVTAHYGQGPEQLCFQGSIF